MTAARKKITLAQILKWVGIVTAVITLLLGVREVVLIVIQRIENEKKAAEFRTEAQQLALSGLYSKAWESMVKAVELDDDSRDAQVDLAMKWLRNIRITPYQKEQTFTEIVEKVAPVLHLAVDTTKREHAATVQAHIGYGMYLLFREGNHGVNVENNFQRALALDSTNAYANAMHGFWILFPGHGNQSIPDANRYFDAAVRSGKERAYVRSMMFSGFRNASGPAYQAQIIRVVNDMRKNGEELSGEERKSVLMKAYSWHNNSAIMRETGKVLSPEDHLQTFLFLSDGVDVEQNKYLKATLDTLGIAGPL